MGFQFREYDMILSFRHYLLNQKIRDNIGDGIKRSLPNLYPSMKNDEEQWGVRLADLYSEERIPCYPCVGFINGGLLNKKEYYNTFIEYQYTIFMDAAFRAEDEYGHIDRDLTFRQKELFFGDLRLLLTENRYCQNIPFYLFNDDGTKTNTDNYIKILQNPVPRIRNSPVSSKDVLGLNINFQLQVLLVEDSGNRTE